jgi:hypothetical protein
VDIPAGLLAAGNANTLELVSDGSSNQDVRIAWIALTAEASAIFSDTYEAESATLSGGAVLGGSGTFVTSMHKLGAACEWTAIQSPSAANATLAIHYANAGAAVSPKTLFVNGVLQGLVNFPVTGTSWSDFSSPPVIVTIPLQAGVNTIKLTRTGTGDSGSLNLDKIVVSSP